MKRETLLILVLLFIVVSLGVSYVTNTPSFKIAKPDKLATKPAQCIKSSTKSAKHKEKRVSFNPTVEVAMCHGTKSDRFNPDLHDCVRRNTIKARQFGGAKRLAEFDLASALSK